MKITILLSTYNGVKYLEAQLDSLYNQVNINDIDILVRDDGSSDGTQEILNRYQKEHKNFSWYQGENLKSTKSFWDLLTRASGSDFYAFCDQDDVWDSDKVKIALDAIKDEDQSNPLMYMSDVRVVDQDLNLIRNEMVAKNIPIDYPKSLMNNICPGCTYLFNEAARKVAALFDVTKYDIELHDWQMYKIVTCFGKVVFDMTAHMSYRQHQNNVVGAMKTKLGFYIEIFKKRNDPAFVRKRLRSAKAMEDCYGEMMSEDNKHLTHLLAHYTEDKKIKKLLLKEKRFTFCKRQSLYFRWRIRRGKF